MRIGIARVLCLAAAGLWLAGCSASNKFPNPFASKAAGPETAAADAPASGESTSAFAAVPPASEAAAAEASASDTVTTGSVSAPPGAAAAPGLLGSDPNDSLSLGKKQYRANNFGLAEKYFRKATELHPRDAEAWLGLAASYDRLRRFDLADRAYAQAIGILGPTAEVLNNQGYSYMLRGDYTRARKSLAAAQHKDPGNKYVQNNIQLLEDSYRQGKAIR